MEKDDASQHQSILDRHPSRPDRAHAASLAWERLVPEDGRVL